ncbi:hypothetical protein OUZ56_019521 [Daphnia magna]|uniref:Methyltransferase domain-containing protein n=1 Tax=Daphnia magna TaxID=35525 RepID=A0ABQ9ZCV6_9CRUS|nr:hypothetical protein OUZ56_019521 [Daphnia magna]
MLKRCLAWFQIMISLNRKASLIVLAVNCAVFITWMVCHPHTPYHEGQQRPLWTNDHDIWTNDIKATESMSAEEIYRYLHWTNSTSCQLAVDFGFFIINYNGVAAPDGHKAVCLDQPISPVFNNCLVYSFGINNQWSFDEAMSQFGCQVYSFDPSMNVGNHDRSQRIHFYKIGLDGENRMHPTTGWKMKTASSIYQMLTSRHGATTLIDVLKMDIEFSEWDAIPQMLQSGFLADKVKQLAVEIHFKPDDPLETFRHRIQILRRLEATNHDQAGGYVRFSSRPNPWLNRPLRVFGYRKGYIGLELAWYNSKYYSSVVNDRPPGTQTSSGSN